MSLRLLWFRVRPFALFALLCWLWATNSGVIEPVGLIATAPERIDAPFTRCGPGRGHACVIDGDTFKLGDRKIRIIGIDAPETHPARCAEEAARGEAATARLQALLSQGPFEMIGSRADLTDRYGRDLRTILRDDRSIADQLRAEGLVRRYMGYRTAWCRDCWAARKRSSRSAPPHGRVAGKPDPMLQWFLKHVLIATHTFARYWFHSAAPVAQQDRATVS